MRRVNTQDLVPGMITAEDVYTFNNQLILPRGLVLTDKTITKLEFYSIINVRVEDEMSQEYLDNPEADEDISYSERIKKSPQFLEFKERFDNEVPKFQALIDSVSKEGKELNVDTMLNCVDVILENDDGYLNVFDMLHNMRQYDDMTYVHSINVALICNVFARWLKMSDEETRLATVCGLLHDIGKISIPDIIIKKPAKLTQDEFAIVKKHALEGYNILRRFDISEHIMNAALMHHERCDGSGYPFGIRNSKIDTYAKLVAIADVYDAMTSARVYRGPMCPFKVIEIFENEGLQKYDTRFIMTFLENIVNTYMLHRVKLNNGTLGDVVFINRSSLARPTIKSKDDFIDLSLHPELYIEAIV
ncbi:MAG: HD-GYP domain-containing protein [Lachnospiraceae bacterium]|nr:HD-GYP domain-containing protein [Lachnospiraceae bacterium]